MEELVVDEDFIDEDCYVSASVMSNTLVIMGVCICALVVSLFV